MQQDVHDSLFTRDAEGLQFWQVIDQRDAIIATLQSVHGTSEAGVSKENGKTDLAEDTNGGSKTGYL